MTDNTNVGYTALPKRLTQDAYYIVGAVDGGRPGGEVIAEARMTISPSLLSIRERKAIAGEIVARWNSHEELVKALRALYDLTDHWRERRHLPPHLIPLSEIKLMEARALLDRIDQGRTA